VGSAKLGCVTLETESSLTDKELLNQFKAIEKMPERIRMWLKP
jgi:hypothetical protein